MLEIKANGKKIMTIGDNDKTIIHDKEVAKENDKNDKPLFTLIEDIN